MKTLHENINIALSHKTVYNYMTITFYSEKEITEEQINVQNNHPALTTSNPVYRFTLCQQ